MPELPEVETVRRGLAPAMEGAMVDAVDAKRPDLRFPLPLDFTKQLAGRTVTQLGRRAKYLIIDFDQGPSLICHLGMSGSFRVEADGDQQTPGSFHHERSKAAAHDHVIFHLTSADGARSRIVYNDPRRFGFMLMADRPLEHPMLAELGIEPVGNSLNGPALASLLKGKKTPLKAALLDQTLIAGLGNIYVSEALWRAGLSPRRSAGSIVHAGGTATHRAEALAAAIRAVIADAILAGGSSLRDYVHADGSLGYFQHSFAVYDREGEACPKPGCAGHVKRIVQSGRSTFYCPACQR
ncbi:MAG TPA: bifunctional DNA-formamidopyrimidine glycosylase/DNA-(apurinic or apyrimidinic site) lyase [Mesorhizobium sp.]|jgi:formamidopyrimidine-DNA glycosylase